MLLKDKKTSGVLMHITSLPSPYGIGSLGEEAFRFVDFLCDSRQTYWQILPLCPTGFGNSPYQSPSAFAGNELLIDLDLLCDDGLLNRTELENPPKTGTRVNYNAAAKFKIPRLKSATESFDIQSPDFLSFCEKHAHWLNDYAAFMTIKEQNGGASFYKWKDSVKFYDGSGVEYARSADIKLFNYYRVVQYLFYRQWLSLKNYANKKGVYIIGDIPFYVSADSADVWKNPRLFMLGTDLTPTQVAGVPPDAFTDDGQLWGNPVYNWDAHARQGFAWWEARMAHCAEIYDVIRIDHFRAFSSYYTVPYGEKTARNGAWKQGVGYPFFERIKNDLGDIDIIAEDLGGMTGDVTRLIKKTGFPNMKVLQFAFDGDESNLFLPKNFRRNCVCYTGTHDNDTTLGWYGTLSGTQLEQFEKWVPQYQGGGAAWRLIRYAVKSRAMLVIIPMQDFLRLDGRARMNLPGTVGGNWRWRIKKSALTGELSAAIRELTKPRN